ncbi:HSP20-like chaperone [Mytilinidion resinicola]|uniref:HSP20-like chaperone n=1 Tax=Mytilinidion resinicola TaxID=574789 RepID=A0A6A6YK88_9PEZI|nr:HSP20-like chaperone [Mytilinidion resinicola]KAF2808327.1 HSP20-like chaperone [Mytilinidion resinicola]
MAPFTNLFHGGTTTTTPTTAFHHTQSAPLAAHQPSHRPLRFLGQLLDAPYPPPPRRHPRHDILAPDFDVRETEAAYFLEGEFPGIRDQRAIRLEWVDRRTLAIEARVGRVDLVGEWDLDGEREREREKKGGWKVHGDGCRDVGEMEMEMEEDGGPCVREAELEKRKLEGAQMEKGEWPVREWLAERRVGHYQRTFTFPGDVDAVGVRARLGQGLLRILVPKVREVGVRVKTVDIENVE